MIWDVEQELQLGWMNEKQSGNSDIQGCTSGRLLGRSQVGQLHKNGRTVSLAKSRVAGLIQILQALSGTAIGLTSNLLRAASST